MNKRPGLSVMDCLGRFYACNLVWGHRYARKRGVNIMTNEELVTRIKAGIDTADNMLALWQQCRLFIHSIALRYHGKAELEDLEQEGYLALYDAVDGYDADMGYKFLTYAERWMRQRMVRYIQNNGTVRIPVHEGEKIREYRQLVNAFLLHHGRKPTRREIALNMGLSDKMVASLEKAAQMAQIGSLDSCLVEDGGTLGDIIPCDTDIEAEVLEEMQQEQLQEVIWALVDELPGQQGCVLRQRFQESKTLKATGDQLGITVDQTRQMEYKALRSMEHSRNARLLRSYLTGEDAYSMGIVGNGVVRYKSTWTSSTERAAIKGIMG